MQRARVIAAMALLSVWTHLACTPSEMGRPLWKHGEGGELRFAKDRSFCASDSRTPITRSNRRITRPSATSAVSEGEFRACMEARGWETRFWRGFDGER